MGIVYMNSRNKFLLLACGQLILSFLSACSTTQEQLDQQQERNDPGFYIGEGNLGSASSSNNYDNSETQGDNENYTNYEDEQGNYQENGQYDNQESNTNDYSNDNQGENLFENSAGNEFNYNNDYDDSEVEEQSQQIANNQPDEANNYSPPPEDSGYQQKEEEVYEPIAEEIMYNVLWWLGLDFREKESIVKVEMVTIGKPIYKYSQSKNPAGQPELIIKFLDTKMRGKLQRPIDASEFLSPVAYIRTKYNSGDNSTDVIITLRDPVKPQLFSHDGNVLLSFKIPDRYFGNTDVGQTPSGKAEVLSEADITPVLLYGSTGPEQTGLILGESAGEANEDIPIQDEENYNDYSDSNPEQINSDFNQDYNENNNYGEQNGNADNSENESEEEDDEDYENENEYEDSQDGEDEEETNQEYEYYNNASKSKIDKIYTIRTIGLFTVAQDDFENNFAGGNNYDNQGEGDIFNSSQGDEFDNSYNQNTQENNIDTSNLDNENLFNNQSYEGNEDYDNVDLSGEETEGQDRASEGGSGALQPISMEFKGAALKEVIRTFTSENGVNFIFPQDVGSEKVDLSFKNVPWDQALQAVLETHSLGLSKLEGNVIRIDRLSTLDQEKKELEKVRETASRLVPTKVLIVRLSYASAPDVVKVVTSMLQSYSHDKRVRVEADTRTNSVIVEAIPVALSKIKALINRVDLQTPQVKIDTRIVEVLKTDTLQLGINWAMPLRTDQSRGLGLGNLPFPNQMYSAFSVDTGIQPADLSNRSSVDLHFGSINNLFELDIRLRMAEQQNQIRSLQNNSVVVLDNEEAATQVGQEIYQPIPVANGEQELASVEYLLSLTVTPHITADGAVQMDIEVENSSAIPSASGPVPDKNKRLVKTKLLRENGQTAVIGGVYTTDYTNDYSGVPFFSRIPLLGVFFRNKTQTEVKRELIIMVTPTVINSNRSLSETSIASGNFSSDSSESNYNNSESNYQGNNSNYAENQYANQQSENGENSYGNEEYEDYENSSNQQENSNEEYYQQGEEQAQGDDDEYY